MARPRTAVGSEGKITLSAQVLSEDGRRWIAASDGTKPQRWRARAKHRDRDGKLRDVERYAPTKGKAEVLLKSALADRRSPRRGDNLHADMPLGKAGEVWLAQVDRKDSGLSERTRRHYRDMFQRYVPGSPLASLTLRQVTVSAVRTFLQDVADTKGAGAAKSVRSILSGILGMAVQDDVLDSNVARQVRSPMPQGELERAPGAHRAKVLGQASAEYAERDTRRAFTRTERDALVSFAQSDDWARDRDVADLVAFLAGLGPRITEALSLRWEDVDLDGGTAHLRGTKTKTSDRVLAMPPWLVDVLQVRAARLDPATYVYVFGAPRAKGKMRDARAVARHLRTVLDRAGMPWATPHTFRRTVASLIADGGLSVALAADVLGHADASFTARVYLGRGGDTARAAALL